MRGGTREKRRFQRYYWQAAVGGRVENYAEEKDSSHDIVKETATTIRDLSWADGRIERLRERPQVEAAHHKSLPDNEAEETMASKGRNLRAWRTDNTRLRCAPSNQIVPDNILLRVSSRNGVDGDTKRSLTPSDGRPDTEETTPVKKHFVPFGTQRIFMSRDAPRQIQSNSFLRPEPAQKDDSLDVVQGVDLPSLGHIPKTSDLDNHDGIHALEGCKLALSEENSVQDSSSTGTSDETYRTTLDPLLAQREFETTKDRSDWGETIQDVSLQSPLRPVHVLGMNKYGKYIAQSLANSGAPVTLLMHRPLVMQDWHDEGESIRLLKGDEVQTTTGYHVESCAIATDLGQQDPDKPVFKRFGKRLEHTTEPPDSIIESLIVATDPAVTIAALSRVAHRLGPASSVCFVQDGLGIIERVNHTFFPDPHERPHYLLANMSHELEMGRCHFEVVERKGGVLSCSKLPHVLTTTSTEGGFRISRKQFHWPLSAKYLVGSLLNAHNLNTQALGHKSFHRQQLMRIAMHAAIDPISVVFEVKSEELLYNYKISQYMKMVLEEISHVILSLPEINTIRNKERDFSVKKLQIRANHILRRQGDKYTDFCLSVRTGQRKTGLEMYMGYLLKRADELGIKCPVLQALMLQVEGKQQYYSRLERGYIPFEQTAKRERTPFDEVDDGKV